MSKATTTTRNAALSALLQAKQAQSRRHLRLIRGKFGKAIAHLSDSLRDSAWREFDRQCPNFGRY
jgi:hypothetical protein